MLSTVIRTVFYPIRVISSFIIFPPALSRHKATLDKQHQAHVQATNPSYDQRLLIIPPRHFCYKSYEQTQNKDTAILPPPCYQSIFKPFSVSHWADQMGETLNSQEGHQYLIAQSIGTTAAIYCASKKEYLNTTFIFVTPPKKLSLILYQWPAFEISILMLHLFVLSLFFIGFGPIAIQSITLAGYAILGTSILLIGISQSYQYYMHKQRQRYSSGYQGPIPTLDDLSTVFFRILNEKTFTNLQFLSLCKTAVMLFLKALSFISLITIYSFYGICYGLITLLHRTSHLMVQGYLWLLDAHHDYEELAQKIKNPCIFIYARQDSLLGDAQFNLPNIHTIRVFDGDHNIDIKNVIQSCF